MKIDFCIPVLNEEKILEENIKKLKDYLDSRNFDFEWKIIIIDNGSTDQTAEISQRISGEKIAYYFIEEIGKGRALKSYWKTASSDIIVYMDSDLSVSLENIPELLSPIIQGSYDLVMGSRMLPESNISRSFVRELTSQSYNFFSRIILKHNFSDLQCGFKAIKLGPLKTVLPYLYSNKFFFDTELVIFLKAKNYKIKEIPVDWEENRYEKRKSKVNIFRHSIGFSKKLFKLRRRLKKI